MQGVTSANWSYTEYAQLPGSIRDDPEGLQEAAKHFESLFINMWLKSAREANAAIAKDSMFSSNEMEMQQEMFDSQMAMHLSKEGGIGLAPTIVRQLSGGVAESPVTPSIPASLNKSSSMPQAGGQALAQTGAQTFAHNDAQSGSVENQADQKGSRSRLFEDPQSFLDTIGPRIKKIVEASGLPSLAVTAQAALETGWGQAVIEDGRGQSSHNLFGLKATNWGGPEIQIHSKEYLLGQWQDKLDGFRAYPDWDAGIADYVQTLSNSPRYASATDSSLAPAEYAEFLQRAGYATDPHYAQKLKGIMHRIVGMGF